MGKVIISNNPVKTKERLDFNGNIIDPRTKQIIVPKEEEYVAPPTPQPLPEAQIGAVASPIPKDDGLSVLEQIEATKRKLAELEELKKAKIEETEKLLNELKKQ
jgi:hypothetical protein